MTSKGLPPRARASAWALHAAKGGERETVTLSPDELSGENGHGLRRPLGEPLCVAFRHALCPESLGMKVAPGGDAQEAEEEALLLASRRLRSLPNIAQLSAFSFAGVI